MIHDENLPVVIVWEVGSRLAGLLYTLIVCQLGYLYLDPNVPLLASVLSHQRLVSLFSSSSTVRFPPVFLNINDEKLNWEGF